MSSVSVSLVIPQRLDSEHGLPKSDAWLTHHSRSIRSFPCELDGSRSFGGIGKDAPPANWILMSSFLIVIVESSLFLVEGKSIWISMLNSFRQSHHLIWAASFITSYHLEDEGKHLVNMSPAMRWLSHAPISTVPSCTISETMWILTLWVLLTCLKFWDFPVATILKVAWLFSRTNNEWAFQHFIKQCHHW